MVLGSRTQTDLGPFFGVNDKKMRRGNAILGGALKKDFLRGKSTRKTKEEKNGGGRKYMGALGKKTTDWEATRGKRFGLN